MKKIVLTSFSILLLLIVSCTEEDNGVPQSLEVNDFVWKGLNHVYFWQANVSNLADSRFKNQDELNLFLNTYSEPEDLFESLLFDTQNVDRFSWIVDDYVALEQQFQGVSMSNGVEFKLKQIEGTNDVLGYVRYILPNSDASTKNIERGDIFLTVDGQQLTLNNYRHLLFSDNNNSYTLGLAVLTNDIFTLTGETVALTKEVYTENPVFITKSFDISGNKIGYLMYNAFTSNFDHQLNEAFAQLKAEGVKDLVLDLRYNGGGSVRTAIYLASMISGQFNGKLFARERWNEKLQQAIENENPSRLVNNFTNEMLHTDSNGNILLQEPINSLNLTKLYVLITGNSASASELIINGLNPYIDVNLIGTKTFGKYVASVTLYDSENFGRSGANSNHTYAMQPIVLEELNNLGVNNKDGFVPHIAIEDDFLNFGILGNQEEPLLQKALEAITNNTSISTTSKKMTTLQFRDLESSKSYLPFYNEMYVENTLILNTIQFSNANR